MSEIATVIDTVIDRGLRRTLKESGFKKHGRTFVREAGAAAQIVHVQASQWNQGAEGNFTLDLGVYFPAVAERRGEVARGAYPREVDSTYRERIGYLLPEQNNRWWELTATSDLGRPDEATEIVLDAYARARPPFAPTVRRFAEKQGIALPER
ncbi:MAG TPA: DUF4304 domain-containing protein [Thermoanaerobaculia bacterium]